MLFAKTCEDAEKLLNIIHITCKRFGLNISFNKTKTQAFNDISLAEKPTLITVDGHVIENVRQFTYLGHIFDNHSVMSCVEHRTARASAKFNQLREVLCDPKVRKKTRKKLLESCVVPRLIYGLQACFPNEEETKKIESCWFQLLRTMVRGGWRRVSEDPEDPDYRFVYTNVELQRIIGAKSIRDILLAHHLRYLGHVCRDENTAITKKMMFADSQVKYFRDPWKKIADSVGVDRDQLLRMTQNRSSFKRFTKSLMGPLQRRWNSPNGDSTSSKYRTETDFKPPKITF